MRPLALILALLAAPALAQDGRQVVSEVEADLDRDGTMEIYTLLDYGPENVDLSVETDQGFQLAPRVVWSGGMAGQRPDLSLSPAGSLLIVSGNEAVGRDRWRLTLTVAHREGDLRVAGLTYEWWDTLDPEARGHCDVNLLSGRGILETEEGSRVIAAPWPAPRLWDWRDEYFDPSEVCGI